ncbi:MAG: hypothetical protein RJB26_194 [Pseudomonadota bacterium]
MKIIHDRHGGTTPAANSMPGEPVDRTRRNALASALGLAGCAIGGFASAAPPGKTLIAADVHVDHYPTVEAVRFLGRELSASTNDRYSVKVYHAGQLGRESDTIDLVRYGGLDITRVNFAVLNNAFPLTAVAAAPFVFDSTDHMRRAMDGAAGQAIRASFASRGLVCLAIYDSGARSFYNVRRPVVHPADLHGLKVRVPPSDLFIAMTAALGANPTPLAYGEVYSALGTHLIDGGENNIRSFHTSRQFEVARFWSNTRHSYSPEALLISRRVFDSMSAGDRDALVDAAQRSIPFMRSLWDAAEKESFAKLVTDGVHFNDVDVAAFRATTRPLLDHLLATPEAQRVHSLIREVA